MGGFPDSGAYVIAGLEKGDIITLGSGAGYPSSGVTRILTVLQVDQFAAICTDGTLLSCHDGDYVNKTGKKDPKPVASLKARWILMRIWWKNMRESVATKIDDIDTKIWLAKHKKK